jgi:hypothetical protein
LITSFARSLILLIAAWNWGVMLFESLGVEGIFREGRGKEVGLRENAEAFQLTKGSQFTAAFVLMLFVKCV